MKIGIVGLGRMGLAISQRLVKAGFPVLGFDPNEDARKNLKDIGGETANKIIELAKACKIIWIMVPAGKPVDDVINQISDALEEKSIIIDGGNSRFSDSVRRAKELEQKDIFFLDCGTSGGLKGKTIGFSLMIGGEKEAYEKATNVFQAVAAPNGHAYMGPSGSGHYVKMIHNGVEYALLQAYADGFDLLKNNDQFKNLDLKKIATVWKNGSVIRSWIVELLEEIFSQKLDFEKISGAIGENLTGRWTLEEANKQSVSMELLEKALEIRQWSRDTGGNFSTKLVALLRNKFGGHPLV
jgi:6-phosphogluconate dehydrogenase